jgi:hypothetical protein
MVSDKGLDKTEEKLRSWGKLSTTKDPRARKYKSLLKKGIVYKWSPNQLLPCNHITPVWDGA